MPFFADCNLDLKRLKIEYGLSPLLAILTSRGFHALFIYRIAHVMYRWRIPLLPLVITRIIQILYSIDIDYKATISGGTIIIHGVGIVIGSGSVIHSGVTIYHDVTLGRKTQGMFIPANDGFPVINENCVLGAGARILGNINIGSNCIIGCNAVVTTDINSHSIVKVANTIIRETRIKD